MRELITTMLWGTEQIRGELLKLGFVVSARSIRRYRRRPRTRPPSQSWRTFLVNHAGAIWAADLFVVQTLGFKTLYVLFFISHGRRELLHFQVTSHPASAWTWRQMIEATAWGRLPRFLIHDRDRVWGADFAARLAAIGIKSVPTPIRAPNPYSIGGAGRGSLRRECLDHIIIRGERHLSTVLAELVADYNHDRPHRTLGLETPVSRVRSFSGEVGSRPILGGLHHAYERAA
ncbi:MAG: integrase core domain-containing protein [Candidatus Dormibacteraceae bacterium]